MNSRTFLIVTTTLVVTGLASYLYLVDSRVLASLKPSLSYPQYLLEASAEVKGKVIVESGSNSQHGIEPAILADYFQGPVIIVARNAGLPLLPKIYNLAEYAQRGDVVILPLEWNLYVDDSVLSSDFLHGVSRPDSSMNYYYQSLPVAEKARFILQQFPLTNVFSSLDAPVDALAEIRNMQARLISHRKLIDSKDKTAFGGVRSKEADPHQVQEHCDGYILGNQLSKKGFTISREFHRALASLNKLTDLGVSVYFTWPAVVDAKFGACYQNKSLEASIENYAGRIRAVVEEAGYRFVGDFRGSHFPEECFADTPYHLTDACAVDRTRRLVAEFSQLGVKPSNSDTTPGQLLARAKVHLEKSYGEIIALLEASLPPVTQVRPNGFNSELLLTDGWSESEEWGVWSIGPQSTVSLRVAPGLLQAGRVEIRLQGRYFNGVEATTVTINGRNFGRHILVQKRFTINPALLGDGELHLQFEHHNVVSPSELGLGTDERKLKFGLTEITLSQVQR